MIQPASQPCALNEAALDASYTITQVTAPAEAPEWGRWLAEIGFLPGERVSVLARGPGGGPLMVRAGSSTFALRQAEAQCVRVQANA